MQGVNVRELAYDDTEYVENFTRLLKKQVYAEKAPWMKSYQAQERETPYNPATGIRINGINALYLDMVAAERGYKDSRWLTNADIARSGGIVKIRSGERPVAIAYLNKYVEMTDIDPTTGDRRKEATTKYYMVYNAEQVKGLPSVERCRATAKQRERIQNKNDNLKKYGITVASLFEANQTRHPNEIGNLVTILSKFRYAEETNTAYYPSTDRIQMKEAIRGLSTEQVLRAAYLSEVQKERLFQKGMELVSGITRTVVRDKEHAQLGRSKDGITR